MNNKRALPVSFHIPQYLQQTSLTTRRIVLALLLSLIVHAVVLLVFDTKQTTTVKILPRILDISFEKSTSFTPPVAEKHITHPRDIQAPSKQPVNNPAPPIIEIPAPATTVSSETTVIVEQSPAPQPERIESISSLTRIPGPLSKIEAAYPASERRAGNQAYVLAEVVIDAQGKVQNVRVVKSGGKAFDNAVIEALNKSEFSPGYIGDKAVPVRISIPFRFNLK